MKPLKILCIASVENKDNVEKQINKQSILPNEVKIWIDETPARGIVNRKKRISENHNELVKIVENNPDFDLIWQLEGDVDLPHNCLEALISDYRVIKSVRPKNFGYISGIQIGRHGLYTIGGYNFNSDKSEFESLNHTKTGIVEADATGFYCLLAERETWLKGNAYWNGQYWGPDVNWGLSLRELGYKIYVDMDLHIGHIIKRGIIRPTDLSVCTAKFYKRESDNKWTFKTT